MLFFASELCGIEHGTELGTIEPAQPLRSPLRDADVMIIPGHLKEDELKTDWGYGAVWESTSGSGCEK